MSENPIINVEVPESVGSVAEKAYDDLGHPISSELGEAAGTIIGLLNTILTPVKLLNSVAKANADNFIKDYQEKIAAIPEHKYCDVNPAIICPMAEHAKYKITEETLREHYLSLMASASNTDNLCKPLLAFDDVLNQLTPVELNLLKKLFLPTPKQNYPIAHIKQASNTGFTILYKNLADINYENLSPNNLATILSNYERLGIINIDMMNYVQPSNTKYQYVKESLVYKSLEQYVQPLAEFSQNSSIHLDFQKGSFSTTTFGESFVLTVLK